MNVEKTCFKCQRSLPNDAFYKHPKMADGLLGKCKDCAKDDVKKYRLLNGEKVKAYEAARSKTEGRKQQARVYEQSASGKDVRFRASKKHVANHPDRAKARSAVWRALKRGVLERQPCFVCGSTAEAHHPDYSAPLSVTWLCKEHHVEAHALVVELSKKPIDLPF